MTVNKNIIKAPDLETSSIELNTSMPMGRAWDAQNLSNSLMSKNIKACAAAFNRVQQQIEELANQFNINLSKDLLPDWSNSVGLPDNCQLIFDSLEAERNAIIQRLRKIAVVNKLDFEQLILELTGEVVTVIPGIERTTFPYTFPLIFGSSRDRFIMYIQTTLGTATTFPYTFPITFSSDIRGLIRCVVEKIIPGNVVLVIE